MKPIVAFLTAALLGAAALAADEKPSKIAVYDLDRPLAESGASAPDLLGLSLEPGRPLTMFELSRSIEKAAADPKVAAVVVDADGAGLGFAQVQEIRRRLLAVRQAGKPVWLYSERLDNGTALLGSAASQFTLMPGADVSFTGVASESLYLKGLLDRLGVQADVIHIGDFKSFGEMFYRTGPSEFAARQQEELLDSVFEQIVNQVAGGRAIEPDKVRELIDRGAMNAKQAVEGGLADGLKHRTDFVAELKDTFGEDANFDRAYELPDLEGPELDGILDIFKLMLQSDKTGRSKKDHVAVVVLAGNITDSSVAPVRREILRCLKDEKAKALVLRVDSPGGSALASEVLWEATDEWRTSGRPFVVSMGGVAASGGYYVSSAAERIFAEAGTITGSIGVVGMKLVVGDALDRLGVSTHTTQRGRHAGMQSMTRAFSEEERELVRGSMLDVYDVFKKRVTDGRGDRLKEDFDKLAGGRVFSGVRALELGLVDELGGLREAIAWAAEKAELDEPNARLRPAPKSPLEGLFSTPKKDDDEIIRGPRADTAVLRLSRLMSATGLPRLEQQRLARIAECLDAWSNTRILLLGPEIEIRW